jgi:2-methylisocitrate lyase-like PEP mutase family enzyme
MVKGMSEKRTRFRRCLQEEGIVIAPGVYDAVGAKLSETIGFDAVYVTGFGCSASLLGTPDIGLITLTELATHAKNIDHAITVPVIADGESGFGNAVNVARTVREYEKAGVAALHIEDQMVPQRYRPDGKPQIAPKEEHMDKIRMAVEAREDEHLVIIGRTDALRRYGLNEAIARANAYVEAGCDMIFVHGAYTGDELKTLAEEISAPQVVNYSTMVESGSPRIHSVSELEELGFKLVIFPTLLLFTAARVMQEALLEFRDTGQLARHPEMMMPMGEFGEMMGWSTFTKAQKRYLPEPE